MTNHDRRDKCFDSDHGLLIVHRDLPGDHDTGNYDCWCKPFIFCPTCEPDYKLPPESEQIAEMTQ